MCIIRERERETQSPTDPQCINSYLIQILIAPSLHIAQDCSSLWGKLYVATSHIFYHDPCSATTPAIVQRAARPHPYRPNSTSLPSSSACGRTPQLRHKLSCLRLTSRALTQAAVSAAGPTSHCAYVRKHRACYHCNIMT